MNDASALHFIEKIYDAALQPQRWNVVMDEFAEVVGAAGTSLQVVDPFYKENHYTSLSNRFRDHPDFEALMKEYFERVWLEGKEGYKALFSTDAPGFMQEYQCMGYSDANYLEQYPPSLWFRDNFDIFNRLASRLNKNRGWRNMVSICYDSSRGEATPEEITYANQFIPHLSQAVEMGRDFTLLRKRFNTVFGALDHYRVGILFVSQYGEVLLLNQAAEGILEQNDGLSRNARGRLCVTTASSADLGQLIRVCAATARGEGIDSEKLLIVERRSDKDSYIVTVAPMRDPGNEIEDQYKGAIVYAIDPTNVAIISTSGLADLYGLTPAEEGVCRLLVSGHETRTIAEQREVSIETVRTQVKRVMYKTGVQNRAALIRLALSVNLPVDLPDSSSRTPSG